MSDPTSRPRPWSSALARILGEGLVVGLAHATAFFVAWPHMWWFLRTRVMLRVASPYRPGDSGGTLFLVMRALTGERGMESRLLAWPDGFSFGGDFNNPIVTDLLAMAVRIGGMPAGFNAGLVLVLVSNGAAVHVAARLAGARLLPALAGGLTTTLAPLLLEEVYSGRPVTAWWAPGVLATGFLVRAISASRSWAWIAAGASFLALALEVYPYQPVLLLPWGMLAGLLALRLADRKRLFRATGAGLVAGLVVLAWALRNPSATRHGLFDMPPNLCQVSLALPDLARWRNPEEELRWVPAVLWIGAAGGVIASWRRARTWLPAAAGALLLLSVALGANLWETLETERCQDVQDLLPYVLGQRWIPWLRGCPRPTRFALPGVMMLSLWVALVLDVRWQRLPRAAPVLTAGASILVVGTLLGSVHFSDLRGKYLTWPPYPPVPEVAGDPVLLDLPFQYADDKVPLLLFASDPIPRMTPPGTRYRDWRRRLDPRKVPLLVALDALERGEAVPVETLARLREGIPEVTSLGLHHVVVHRAVTAPDVLSRWSALLTDLGARTLREDDWYLVFDLQPEGGR